MKSVKVPTQRMTKAKRLEEWKAFIRICFLCLDEKDDKEVSNLTLLSASTIHRLRQGRVSLSTRIGTVQALGFAAGLQLKETEAGCMVRVID